MSNELIHDVEESLKQERLQQLWREYGPYLIAGVVLAVLFTALISGYRSWQYKVNTSNTAVLIAAMSGDNIVEEIQAIDQTLDGGQRAVAKLSQAGIYLDNDQHENAWVALKEAAADKAIPETYRNLARLEAIRIGWGEGLGDTTAEDHLAALEKLYGNSGSPWRFHALYQAALISGEDKKDYEAAHGYLSRIVKSSAAPPSLIQQARALISLYQVKDIQAAADDIQDGS